MGRVVVYEINDPLSEFFQNVGNCLLQPRYLDSRNQNFYQESGAIENNHTKFHQNLHRCLGRIHQDTRLSVRQPFTKYLLLGQII